MKSIQSVFFSIIVPVLVTSIGIAQSSQKLESPKLTPTPLTTSEKKLLQEGIALHDRKLYAEAIAKYTEAIKTNQTNDLLLYEAAYSFYNLKEYDKATGLLYEAAQYKGNSLGHIYVMLGNILDERGDPKKAIETYNFGLKQLPKEGALYYNLAITLQKQNRIDEAKKAAKQSARFRPDHPSTHLLLSQLFFTSGDRIPTMLAAARYLTLEPNSERADLARNEIRRVLLGGVEKTGENKINISVPMGSSQNEGDFSGVEFSLGMSKITVAKDRGTKSETQLLIGQMETVLDSIDEDSGKSGKSKFVKAYYLPYFLELGQRKYVETFCYLINSKSEDAEVKEWISRNQAKIDEFKSWSLSFKWAFAE
jgi:tetratricopeptide (TPR) repeat protein